MMFGFLTQWLDGEAAVDELPAVHFTDRGMLRVHYSFVNGSGFLENFLSTRLLVIKGRLGSGKSLLGMALARYLYDQNLVDGIFANIPVDPGFIPVVDHIQRAAVMLDEAWTVADPRLSMQKYKGYGAFARKFDSWWISPSKNGVDLRVADLRCKRMTDLWVLDWWVYRWETGDAGDIDKGWFVLRNYRDLYDTYFHKAVVIDDGGILEALEDEVRTQAGYNNMLRSMMGGRRDAKSAGRQPGAGWHTT